MFRKKGFTLLELIIVIIVIGILASLALPRYLKVAEKGRATEGKQAAGIIRSAQVAYKAQYGNYSTSLVDLDLCITLTYFGEPTLADDPDALATLGRNTKDAGPYAYTITATVSGLNCTGTGTSCADIGMGM